MSLLRCVYFGFVFEFHKISLCTSFFVFVSSSYDEYSHEISSIARVGAYFAIVGLLRMHTLYGDYSTALRVLDAIDLSNRVRFLPCRLSLCTHGLLV